MALSLTVFFPIETIAVTGGSRYADGDLITASGLSTGNNIFCFRAASVEEQLVKQFPYIERARVTRAFPDTVSIEVSEAEIDAVIETEAGFLPLSRRGRILEPPSAYPPEGWPRVIGFSLPSTPSPGSYLPDEEQERFALLRQIKAEAEQNALTPVSILDLRDPIQMRLLYDGRLAIELGSKIDLSYKLRAAAEVIRLSVNEKTVGTLDVSVRPTMRLRELDLYAADRWPFPEAMRSDYQRAIPKIRPILPKPEAPSEASPSPPPATSSSAPAAPAPEQPDEPTDDSSKEVEQEEDDFEEELPPLTIIEG